MKVETSDRAVTMIIKNCERSDAGNYTVAVKNDAGSDSASIQIKIFDKPSPPRGPLEQTDVTENAVTLSWRPPQEDGGSRIFNYIVEKQGELDFKWKPVTDKNITDLTYRVTGLKEYKRYQFRVTAQSQFGISEPLEGQDITPKGQYGE